MDIEQLFVIRFEYLSYADKNIIETLFFFGWGKDIPKFLNRWSKKPSSAVKARIKHEILYVVSQEKTNFLSINKTVKPKRVKKVTNI